MAERGPWRLVRKPDLSQPTYPSPGRDGSGRQGYLGGWISPVTAVALAVFAAVLVALLIWAAVSP